MKPKPHTPSTAVLGILSLICVGSSITLAGTLWDGGGSDGNWGNGENWDPDGAPSPGNTTDLTFGGTSNLSSTYNYGNGDDFRDLTFDVTAGAFVINPDSSGKGIDWFGTITNNSTETQTLGINLYLQSGTRTINAAAGNIQLNGGIFNNANVLKINGTATSQVALNYGATFDGSGNVEVDSGTFRLGGASFAAVARTYTTASGATLNINGNTGIASGTTSVTGAGRLLISGGTFGNEGGNDPVGPGRSLVITLGSGSLIEIEAGATMINGGWQNTTWTNNLANLHVDGTFNVWDGQTVIINSLSGSGLINKTQGGGNVDLRVGADNGSGDFSGVFSAGSNGGWTLVKVGTGTQSLSGTTDYNSGRARVENGVLELNMTSNAGVHAIGGGLTVTGGIARLGGTGNDQIYDGTGVTVNGGTFDLNGRSETIKFLNGNGGTVENNTATQSVITFDQGFGGGGGNQGYGGTVAGNIRVTVINSPSKNTDVQTFTGTNTFTGGILIDNGHLRANADAALGAVPSSFDAANITLQNGGVLQNNDSDLALNANRGITLGTGGGVIFAGWAGNRSVTIPGGITGVGSLTKTDGAPLILNGTDANTYTGGTIFLNGRIDLAKPDGVIAIPGDILFTGGPSWNGSQMAAGVRLLANEQVADTAVLTWSGLTNFADFRLRGFTETIGGLVYAAGDSFAIVENNGPSDNVAEDGTLILNVTGSNAYSYNGQLRDQTSGATSKLNLIKSGTGTQTLAGNAITYSGNTTITEGTLKLDGDASIANSPVITVGDNSSTPAFLDVSSANSTFSVGASQTLQGDGTIIGNMNVTGVLSPGNSPGVLTVDGDLGLNGALNLEINGLTPASGHDQLAVNGTIFLGGILNLSWNLASIATPGTELILISNDDSDTFTGSFSNLADLAILTDNLNQSWELRYFGGTGNDLSVVAMIPEPSSALLLGLGSLGLALRRRRHP